MKHSGLALRGFLKEHMIYSLIVHKRTPSSSMLARKGALSSTNTTNSCRDPTNAIKNHMLTVLNIFLKKALNGKQV